MNIYHFLHKKVYNKKPLQVFIFTLFFLLIPNLSLAQKATIKSGNYKIYLGDSLNIPLKIENTTTVPKIEFPDIKNIKFSAGDRANFFNYTSFVNGKVTRSKGIEITIVVTPQEAGEYNITGIYYYNYNKNNKKIKTDSFTLQVLKPKINNFMITEIIPNKKKYYQGEKINLSLNWYLKGPVNNYALTFDLLKKKKIYNIKNLPTPNNIQKQFFRFSPLDNIPFTISTISRNGESYALYNSKFSLFVNEVGIWNKAVFSAKGNIHIPTKQEDIFGKIISKQERIFTDSPLLELEILPLPPSPANFSQGVGILQAQKNVSPTKIKVGEAIIFKLKISGTGNFHAINPPPTNIWEKDFEVYHREDQIQIGDDFTEFSYILRPKNQKIQYIPAIYFTYFDLSKEDYNVQKIAKTPIQVKNAEKLSLDNVVSFAPLEKNNKQNLEIAIVPKFSKIKASTNIAPLATALFFIPPFGFFSLSLYWIWQKKRKLYLQKQLLLAKYTPPKNTDFSKKILYWMYQFLLQKKISEPKIQSIIFHYSKLNKLNNCTPKQIALLEKLRLLYKEIVFGKKPILTKQKKAIQKEIKSIFYV